MLAVGRKCPTPEKVELNQGAAQQTISVSGSTCVQSTASYQVVKLGPHQDIDNAPGQISSSRISAVRR
jgi:hypothetical protein